MIIGLKNFWKKLPAKGSQVDGNPGGEKGGTFKKKKSKREKRLGRKKKIEETIKIFMVRTPGKGGE